MEHTPVDKQMVALSPEEAQLLKAAPGLLRALETLVGRYWCNKGSNGEFPHPGEFIACITPTGIPEYWQEAGKAIAKATGGER